MEHLASFERSLWPVALRGCVSGFRFRQWCSVPSDLCLAEELEAYVRPKTETKTALTSFADSNGLQLSEASANGDLFAFTTTVARANALFRANFRHFTHVSSGATLARTLAYSLPSELVGHVQTIAPMTSFTPRNPRMKLVSAAPRVRASRDSTTLKACHEGTTVTPTCLQVQSLFSLTGGL
jgi:tripeptidyl-peptidase-1